MTVLAVFYEGDNQNEMRPITMTADPDIISKMTDVWESEVDALFPEEVPTPAS